MLRTMLYILMLTVCTNCSKSGGVDASTTIANQLLKQVIFNEKNGQNGQNEQSNKTTGND